MQRSPSSLVTVQVAESRQSNGWRLLDTGFRSAAENMALDQVLLESRAAGEGPNTLRFLQFSKTSVLVGCHQQLDQEVRLDFCAENGLEVNRRVTGGGAVVFEPCHIGWEIIVSRNDAGFQSPPGELAARFSRIVCEALRRETGIEASFRPRNDIEVNGRKISGTGGATEGDAILFQGTLLVDLDIATMLRALRVPMEKLKAHEVDSLMERVTTLRQELGHVPDSEGIKRAIVESFAEAFSIKWRQSELSSAEQQRLDELVPEFESPAWVDRKAGRSRRKVLKAVHRGEGGVIRLLLDADTARGRIRSVVLSGDFFSHPTRAVYDLESRFKDSPARMESVVARIEEFFPGGISPFPSLGVEDFRQLFQKCLDKVPYLKLGFTHDETNDLFPVCGSLPELMAKPWGWFLLPYCSKDLECQFRHEDGCSDCGLCTIGEGYELARYYNLKPVTITSFEDLQRTLRRIRAESDRGFLGCCCEGFYTKHAEDFERAGVPGVLVAMDSTTCYDLGKARSAYHGTYDHQTDINVGLLSKVLALRRASL